MHGFYIGLVMIEQTPKLKSDELKRKSLLLAIRADVQSLLNEADDKYWYWSDVKYKNRPVEVTSEELWHAIKFHRLTKLVFTWPKYNIKVFMTNYMQKICHYFDMNFGGVWGNDSILPKDDRERYLVSQLMEEAIASSQIEGASTTRKVAKEMLRKKISPRSRSEQMIVNNYESIRFISAHKDEELTPEMLLHIHALMTKNTLENEIDEGRFRSNDDVVVENSITHEVVHTPPTYTDISEFISQLCDFANSDDEPVFVHPVVKAIIIHFMLAYVHPFVDGNGRTARALFYWYMLKRGYWLTEYLSISSIIYKSKASYEKSYLYAEADEGDMGYFITYHLHVLELAFSQLQSYISRKIKQRQNSTKFLLLGDVNERQATILTWLRENPNLVLTVKEVETRFAVSHPTARLDVEELVNRGLLLRVPVNKVKNNYIKGDNFDSFLMKLEDGD